MGQLDSESGLVKAAWTLVAVRGAVCVCGGRGSIYNVIITKYMHYTRQKLSISNTACDAVYTYVDLPLW